MPLKSGIRFKGPCIPLRGGGGDYGPGKYMALVRLFYRGICVIRKGIVFGTDDADCTDIFEHAQRPLSASFYCLRIRTRISCLKTNRLVFIHDSDPCFERSKEGSTRPPIQTPRGEGRKERAQSVFSRPCWRRTSHRI